MHKKILVSVGIVIIVIAIISLALHWKSRPSAKETSTLQSPSPTTSSNTSDSIHITSPHIQQTTTHTITITGQARGTWYFEASFPIHLHDTAGKTIASTAASAKGDWMTVDFVPFEAQLAIPPTFSGPAILTLEKDNPSGLPQNADFIQIPIIVAAE